MVFLKKLLRIAAVTLVVLLAFACGALAVLTLTATGRESLAGLISTLASSPGQTVRISGLSGIWLNPLRIDQVLVEDGKGPWLAVRDVEVDWSRLALLGSAFDAERIAAGRIELARLPEPAATPKTNTEPFSLPVSLNIGQIALPDIALGAELAGGRVASVAAKGNLVAQASPLTVKTDVSVVRTDGTAGDLDASINFVPGQNLLDLDLRASESSGGILSTLLRLPGTPRVDILVSGTGAVSDWRGTGTLAVDGKVVTSLAGTHRLTPDGRTITARGDGDFARFVPERYRALLGEKSEFDIAGTLAANGGGRIERAMIESSALNVKASGSLDPAGKSDLTFDLSAKGGGVPLSFGTEESPIDLTVASASVRASGSGRTPALDITATLPSVTTNVTKIANLAVTLHSNDFDVVSRTGPVTGSATADSLVVDNPTIAPLVAGAIRVGLKGTLSEDALDVETASLRSDAVDGTFGGNVSLADGSIKLDLKAKVLSAALPQAARPLLGESVDIATSIERDTEGNVSANSLAIQSEGVSGGGAIRISGDQIDANLQGNLADVARIAAKASGSVAFTATAKGALAAPDVNLVVSSERMTVAERELTGLELTATGKADIDNPAATVALKGVVAGEALSGGARLRTEGGKRVLEGLSLSLGSNTITGNLELDEKFVPVGSVDFELPDIGPLSALALETAEGDLRGTAKFVNVEGRPELAVEANANSVSRGDVSARDVAIKATVSDYLAAPVVSGNVRAAQVTSGTTVVKDIDVALTRDGSWTGFDGGATVADIPARAAGRVQIADGKTVIELKSAEATVNGVKVPVGGSTGITIENGAASLKNVEIDLGGGKVAISGTTGANLDLDVTLTGVPASLANPYVPKLDAAGSIDGTARITGSAANPTADFSIKVTGGETAQTRAANLGPLAVAATGKFMNRRLTFDAGVTGRGGLGIKGKGSVDLADPANPAIDVDLQLAGLPASVANGFSPALAAAGTISGTAKVTGTPARPSVRYAVDWSGARTSQTAAAGFGAFSVRSSGTFADNKLKFDANLAGSGLTLKGGGTVAIGGTPRLDLAFDGNLPFAFLGERLAAQGLSLSGAAGISLRIRGAASAPAIEGTVRASGARFVDARSGLAVNDISVDIALGLGRATITRFAGTLSTGGTLSASGSVGIDPGQGVPADLSIRIKDGRYTDGQVVTTTLSGDLAVKGPLLSAPLLTGTVTLGRTVITVPEKLSSSLAALDVQHKNAPTDVVAQDRALRPKEASGGGSGLALDVTVNAPQQIFVQGRGLDAELGGSLKLTGPVSAPQAIGQFTMRRGRLSVLGRRLTFTRGTLGFSGSLVPYLDLAAESTVSDATVTVLVTGPANNPKFLFQSTPSLPEDEVLARLVFGRSMSNLSPVQIAQLAEGAAQFAGVGGSTSLLTSLRNQLGVDDLDIKTDDQGGTAVSAGKYLNDRTYVTIEKGDKAGSGKAAIDLNVGRGVKLRGEATDDGEAKGGIFFEREY